MNCPNCGCDNDRVIDSRERYGGKATRRRRECKRCKHRWSSTEAPDEIFDEIMDMAATFLGFNEMVNTTCSEKWTGARQFFK
jgi:transcriptional regulator NrdR family protein